MSFGNHKQFVRPTNMSIGKALAIVTLLFGPITPPGEQTTGRQHHSNYNDTTSTTITTTSTTSTTFLSISNNFRFHTIETHVEASCRSPSSQQSNSHCSTVNQHIFRQAGRYLISHQHVFRSTIPIYFQLGIAIDFCHGTTIVDKSNHSQQIRESLPFCPATNMSLPPTFHSETTMPSNQLFLFQPTSTSFGKH